MPSPIRTTTRGKNIDRLIKMHGSTDSTSDEEPIASMKPKCKKKTKTNTKSVKINNLPPNEAIAGMSIASMNNQSASKTSTAATAATTVLGDIANVNLPKKRKAKKSAMRTALPTRRNPKHKNDLDEGTVDAISQILRKWRIMCRVMSATGHKQLSVNIQNLHCRNVSVLIAIILFITYVKLPGSKGKGIQIPLHVTAAFTTHTTNIKI